jgi:flagellar hook-basal body complex protein FliE
MAIAGQFRPVDHPATVGRVLAHGIELVEEISTKLQRLDNLMLTGKPQDISEAAAAVESALKHATPAFAEIAETMGALGANTLAAAAAQLRQIEENDAAQLAEALRASLTRFSKRSVSASRRAQQLSRGLNAALKTLQALGVQESGRLIAEA